MFLLLTLPLSFVGCCFKGNITLVWEDSTKISFIHISSFLVLSSFTLFLLTFLVCWLVCWQVTEIYVFYVYIGGISRAIIIIKKEVDFHIIEMEEMNANKNRNNNNSTIMRKYVKLLWDFGFYELYIFLLEKLQKKEIK